MSLSLGAEIATYLQGQSLGLNFSGAGTINLFVGLLLDQPDDAVGIFERGGFGPVIWQTGVAKGGIESKIDRPTFMVRVRGAMNEFTQTQTLAQSIYGALHDITGTYLNGTLNQYFVLIEAIQSPVYLGRDPKERHEWSQNFQVVYKNDQR